MASRPQRRKPENRNAERIGLLNLLRPPSKVHAQAPSVTPEPALVNHAEKSANNSAVVVPSRPPGLDHGKNAWNHIEHIDLVRQAFHHGLTSAWPKGRRRRRRREAERQRPTLQERNAQRHAVADRLQSAAREAHLAGRKDRKAGCRANMLHLQFRASSFAPAASVSEGGHLPNIKYVD